jgi:hypothetical protein
MKKLFLAAVMLVSASTAAMADDPWIMAGRTCQIPQYSLADFFRMISEYSTAVGLPQPQVDYTSGAKNGATIIHYTDPNTRNPGMIVYFGSRASCEAFRERAEAWTAAGRPALQ